jgi:integrase
MKLTINFKHSRKNKNPKKDEKINIECVLRYGNPTHFLLPYRVTTTQWDSKKQSVKNHPNANEINQKLLDFKSLTRDYENESFADNKNIKLDDLKGYILNGRGAKEDFIAFCENYIQQEKEMTAQAMRSEGKRSKFTAERTVKNWAKFVNILKQYRSTLSYSELDKPFVSDFHRHLKTSHDRRFKTEKVLLSDNYIATIMKLFRKFVELADEKLIHRNLFKQVETKRVVGKKHPISYDDVLKIHAFDCSNMKAENGKLISALKAERYQYKKDLFVFQCLTGLSYADLFRVTKESLYENEGVTWISSERAKNKHKTDKHFHVPISKFFDGIAHDIWIKNARFKMKSAPVFPLINYTPYNIAIRRVAAAADVTNNENLRNKDGRDTFVQLLREKLMLEEKVISDIVGHTNTAQTGEYGLKHFENLGRVIDMQMKTG